MFYDHRHYQKIAPLAEDLIARHAELKEICQSQFSSGAFLPWHEPIHSGGWSVHGRVWEDQTVSKETDALSSILVKHREMIRTAGFSRLEPNTEIQPHVGYTGQVLRLHLGIDIPEGECALVVNGVSRKWSNGEVLIFDDVFEHSAYNKTSQPRTILLIDVYKRFFL